MSYRIQKTNLAPDAFIPCRLFEVLQAIFGILAESQINLIFLNDFHLLNGVVSTDNL